MRARRCSELRSRRGRLGVECLSSRLCRVEASRSSILRRSSERRSYVRCPLARRASAAGCNLAGCFLPSEYMRRSASDTVSGASSLISYTSRMRMCTAVAAGRPDCSDRLSLLAVVSVRTSPLHESSSTNFIGVDLLGSASVTIMRDGCGGGGWSVCERCDGNSSTSSALALASSASSALALTSSGGCALIGEMDCAATSAAIGTAVGAAIGVPTGIGEGAMSGSAAVGGAATETEIGSGERGSLIWLCGCQPPALP